MKKLYQPLFDQSREESRGLLFFVNGQTIPGIVRRVVDDEAVEVYNQSYDQVVIILDRIDAVAIQ